MYFIWLDYIREWTIGTPWTIWTAPTENIVLLWCLAASIWRYEIYTKGYWIPQRNTQTYCSGWICRYKTQHCDSGWSDVGHRQIWRYTVTLRHGCPWRDSRTHDLPCHTRALYPVTNRDIPLGKPSGNLPSLYQVTYLPARVDLVPRSQWQYLRLTFYPAAPGDKGHRPILFAAPFVTLRHWCPWRDSNSRPFVPHASTLPRHR